MWNMKHDAKNLDMEPINFSSPKKPFKPWWNKSVQGFWITSSTDKIKIDLLFPPFFSFPQVCRKALIPALQNV